LIISTTALLHLFECCVSRCGLGGDLFQASLPSREEGDANAARRHLARDSSPMPEDALVTSAQGPYTSLSICFMASSECRVRLG
jgi:hypothetical protein